MIEQRRQFPGLSIGGARGTADSANFANLLSKGLHSRFDSTVAESLPQRICDLIDQLQSRSQKLSD
jgi:hypothetical protein